MARENFLRGGSNVIVGQTRFDEDSIYAEQITAKPAHDAVNHPKHYTHGGIECIEAMEAALTPEEFRGYLKGQIMKYNWRLGHKDEPKQEAGKLLWYANRLQAFLSKLNKGG